MRYFNIIGAVFTALFLTITSASAASVSTDLTQGHWELTVYENNPTLGLMDYTGSTLHFDSQTQSGSDWTVTGYFDWTLKQVSGGLTFAGKEFFAGTLDSDGKLSLFGQSTDKPSQIAVVNYWAYLDFTGMFLTDGSMSFDTNPDNAVDYFGWSAAQTISTVPLPGAVWAFGAALVGLAGVIRRRRML